MVGAITETWSFEKLVKSSGYRNVVTMDNPPTALVHDGPADERIVTNGVAAFYVSQRDLSLDATVRARQLLERLHDLADWAAGETVERYRRDEERLASGYYELKPRLTPPQMLVRRFVKRNPGSSLDAISVGSGIAGTALQAIVDELCDRGILFASDQDDATYDLTATELERYQTPDL